MNTKIGVAAVLGAAVLGLVVLLATMQPGLATLKGKNDQSNERDGHSRNESETLNHIRLLQSDGMRLRIERIIVVQTKFVYIADTSFGVDFESLDKVDVGEVPLLGSLFGDRLSAEDLNDDNQVGSVYLAGANSLATVVSDDVDVSDYRLSVVNGQGVHRIKIEPKIVEVAPSELGELGGLPSVEAVLAQEATPETTVMLGGLQQVDESESEKIPFFGDIPVLKTLFRGTTHRGEDHELHIFVRPSILTDDDVS